MSKPSAGRVACDMYSVDMDVCGGSGSSSQVSAQPFLFIKSLFMTSVDDRCASRLISRSAAQDSRSIDSFHRRSSFCNDRDQTTVRTWSSINSTRMAGLEVRYGANISRTPETGQSSSSMEVVQKPSVVD